ncbi:hypothetical protein [Catellatospora vulcania]|nr:hypothetical protein [Catellatospora vulcania]
MARRAFAHRLRVDIVGRRGRRGRGSRVTCGPAYYSAANPQGSGKVAGHG